MNEALLQSCVLSSYCAHHGEEPMISGSRGSGTIFFAKCCLKCVYCQNYQISQQGMGEEVRGTRVADIMLELQEKGCHNINLVSPTHYGPIIIAALDLAKKQGLKIPVVYNTGGYDSIDLLKKLDGKIDIYLPDFKYYDNEKAFKYSGAKKYVERARAGIAEMFRQVGNIELNGEGVAERGVLVRHLVLPNNLADSEKVLDFIASLSKDIWVSLMAQYSPQYRANEFPELSRKLKPEEYQRVVAHAERIGLHHLYIQELESSDVYLPDFKREEPFAAC